LREAISFAASSSGERAGEGGRGSAGVEESAGSRRVVSVGEGVCGCLALTFDEDMYSILQQKGKMFEEKVKRSEVRPLSFY
jgi:hypothetical protein